MHGSGQHFGTPFCVALHDLRLKGGVPRRANFGIVDTNEHKPLNQAFSRIRKLSHHHPTIHTLFILCHGRVSTIDEGQRVSRYTGGRGLLLGAEGLNLEHIRLWQSIRGVARNIVVMACAAAETPRGAIGTTSDGEYLMGALAIHTEATVYAADRVQIYYRYRNLIHGRFDFADWEGQLYAFSPSGAPAQRVERAPIELSDVLGELVPRSR